MLQSYRGSVSALLLLVSPATAQHLGNWCLPELGCIPITCQLVKAAAASASQEQRNSFMARATPAQRAAGQRCLGRTNKPVKKIKAVQN